MKRRLWIIWVVWLLMTPSAKAKESRSFAPTESGAQAQSRRSPLSSFSVEFGAGVGLNIPDILPLEAYALFSPWFGVRAFYVPKIPFNVRVEMPRDTISSQKGVIIEHPALTIPFEANYGPQYGMEIMGFPFGGEFYLSLGTSYRKLALRGGVETTLFLTSAASGNTVETNTSFRVNADAWTSQIVTRFGAGWFWRLANNYYFNLSAGFTAPRRAGSDINVDAVIRNPQATDPADTSAAIEELQRKKEEELEGKARKAMRPVEKLALPVIGFSIGTTF